MLGNRLYKMVSNQPDQHIMRHKQHENLLQNTEEGSQVCCSSR